MELQIFNNEEFGSIRGTLFNGEPWFIGKDVSDILGYKEVSSMRKLLDQNEYMEINPQKPEFKGFVQNGSTFRMLLVNESGVYHATFNSTLSKAKEFRHWVTSKVLPSIRKTGSYSLSIDPKYLIAEALIEANKIMEEQQKRIEYLEPQAKVAFMIDKTDDCILIRELAKIICQNGYDIGEKRLFKLLRDKGYLISCGTDYNTPTQKSISKGLFRIKEHIVNNPDGTTKTYRTKS